LQKLFSDKKKKISKNKNSSSCKKKLFKSSTKQKGSRKAQTSQFNIEGLKMQSRESIALESQLSFAESQDTKTSSSLFIQRNDEAGAGLEMREPSKLL
jgi:hypothetical protein